MFFRNRKAGLHLNKYTQAFHGYQNEVNDYGLAKGYDAGVEGSDVLLKAIEEAMRYAAEVDHLLHGVGCERVQTVCAQKIKTEGAAAQVVEPIEEAHQQETIARCYHGHTTGPDALDYGHLNAPEPADYGEHCTSDEQREEFLAARQA